MPEERTKMEIIADYEAELGRQVVYKKREVCRWVLMFTFGVACGFFIGLATSTQANPNNPTDGWAPPPADTFGCEAVYVCDENDNCQWIRVCH